MNDRFTPPRAATRPDPDDLHRFLESTVDYMRTFRAAAPMPRGLSTRRLTRALEAAVAARRPR